MEQSPKDKLIIALDVATLSEAERLVDVLKDYCSIFKVGPYLFCAEGIKAVELIQKHQREVFLDLKFHDIPSVVGLCSEVLTRLGIYMFTVHTLGGRKMMNAATEACISISKNEWLRRPFVLGVTILTSHSEDELKRELFIEKGLNTCVCGLALLAKECGLSGVVASPWEIRSIRKVCEDNFIIVTPGLRPKAEIQDDQKRTKSPSEAIRDGADFIVIGRPIIKAKRPWQVAEQVVLDIERNAKKSK